MLTGLPLQDCWLCPVMKTAPPHRVSRGPECYPREAPVQRFSRSVCGVDATRFFSLIARAAKLVSFTVPRCWKSDLAAQVGFLSLGAKHEWCLDNGEERSPETAVTTDRWDCALVDVTGIAAARFRIAQVRIVNAMSQKCSRSHEINSDRSRGSGSLETPMAPCQRPHSNPRSA